MEKIKISSLLDKYKKWVDEREIEFLKDISDGLRGRIIQLIEKLRAEVIRAEEADDLSRNLKWYKAHQIGEKLWQELASAALNKIDKGSKGNRNLFTFLKRATEFEDLLYGLDVYYRDHTLHSLWVYFIGEYILRDHLPELHNNLNWYLYNDIEAYEEAYSYPNELVDFAKIKQRELNNKVQEEYRDAIWCIIALCHDLGYSLEKLKLLNKKVRDVVDLFDIPNITDVGYFLDVEHQNLISQFLELMAMDVRIVPSEDYKKESQEKDNRGHKKKKDDEGKDTKSLEEKTLIKCYRDDSTYWRLCRALEKKQHGLLGAYLIYKILGIFADTSVRGSAEEWGLEDEEVIDNVIRGDILFAIAQHTFDFTHLYELNSLADILILADELEEFSRYGRQLLAREYHDTMAWSGVEFDIQEEEITRIIKKEGVETKREEKRTYITINISYEVAPEHKLTAFFAKKAETICKFYSLDQKEEKRAFKPVFYEIKKVKMRAEQGDYELEFDFSKGPEHRLGIKTRPALDTPSISKEYWLICQDDKLKFEDNDTGLDKFLESFFEFDGNKITGIGQTSRQKEEAEKESEEE